MADPRVQEAYLGKAEA
ncbi:hypothetical protein ABTK03_20710 [Acinetobacter baumannii]